MQQEIARRCKYTVAAFAASNTDLLTCVREIFFLLRPRPTFSQVVPAMANFRPGGQNRFGVASRAQHRFVSAFLPASLPVLLKRALRTWRVLRYFNIQFYSKSSSVGYLRTGRGPSSRWTSVIHSLSYTIFRRLASKFLLQPSSFHDTSPSE